jgi:hypothetical protein
MIHHILTNIDYGGIITNHLIILIIFNMDKLLNSLHIILIFLHVDKSLNFG